MSNPKKRIGKYVIYMGQKIGSGSYSEVYLGIEEQTKEEVAVKVLRKDKIMEDQYTKNAFYSEIQINKKLKSPNIIKFYDVHETLNNFYIILEIAQGGNLRQSLVKAGRFDEKKTLKCLVQILNGFGEFAKHGVTHRDLKPENILIKEDVLKIADFGFAKQYEQKSTPLKTVVGTPAYMAPQILNQERYSYKCDIWSLGVIVYEMMVGKIPWTFTEKTIEGYRKEITTREVTFPGWLEISEPMKDLILGCLCIDEKKRYDWQQIFLHPLFQGKFSKNFADKQKGATQLHFIIANLRLSLHSKNINLSRILSRFGERLSEKDFLNLIASLSKEVSSQEADLLYHFVAAPDGSVPVEAFQALLIKYGCRMTGIDISKKEMQCEQNAAMRSSKPGIGVFSKIKAAIEGIDEKVRDVLQPKRFAHGQKLSFEDFGKLVRLLDPALYENQLAVLYKQFDTDGDNIVTIQDAYNGICKIGEIVPMEEE